jgi:hypothetical protein
MISTWVGTQVSRAHEKDVRSCRKSTLDGSSRTVGPARQLSALGNVIVVWHGLEVDVIPRQQLAWLAHRDQRQVVGPESVTAKRFECIVGRIH